MAIVLSHQEESQRVGPVTTPVDESSISEAKRTRYHHLCQCNHGSGLGYIPCSEPPSLYLLSSIERRQFYPMPRGMWKATGKRRRGMKRYSL
jgi:hypothetical protein